MIYRITKPEKTLHGNIYLTASKSESNRVLLIQAFSKQPFNIINLANSQDTQILSEILKNETLIEHQRSFKKLNAEINYYTGAGGTTIRFLTAFFANRYGTRILTGSERINKRPIKPLVDSLNKIGADISYLKKTGYPPLLIKGREIKGGKIEIDASISSQFITALLLLAPILKDGLTIHLKGRVVSRSYIMMTFKVLKYFGIVCTWEDDIISIPHQDFIGKDYYIEADWSAASYWYAMVALAEEADIKIHGLKKISIQGDAVVSDIFQFFGVNTEFIGNTVRLTKTNYIPEDFTIDFSDYPDIAQTLAVIVAAKGIPAFFNGLHTLRIKETDRIQALLTELAKIGIQMKEIGEASIEIKSPARIEKSDTPLFQTYNDHRMAMSFAPLALVVPEVKIEYPYVVKKSYPNFWNDMRTMGFEINNEG
ncbi:MAG: 3-phosphoshikimate 1-carboxyvinyltransferase [Bacteroidota bacterium]